jgi:nitroimidazol reductase NimA-like FMN-containing flavoprotein (pyridoxamine 5'-phosphate oxidase superfamily)
VHVSFPPGDDDFPVILPMLGCTGSFEKYGTKPSSEQKGLDETTPGSFPADEEDRPAEDLNAPRSIYLHGSATARLFRTPGQDKIPICICATAMQGIVLALTPFHNSCNYASVVVHGYASVVISEEERLYALTRITDNLVPGRWDRSRNPPTKAEMTSTGVLRVDVVSASAKVRVGGPSDDRHDLKNESVINNVWTGVIPCWTKFGEPVPSDYNKVKTLPGYLKEFVHDANQHGEREALEIMKREKK